MVAGTPPPRHSSATVRRRMWSRRLGPPPREPRTPRGAIDEPHGGCDVGAEPEDGEWWTRLEDGRLDPDVLDRRRCSLSTYSLTNTDLVLFPGGTSEDVVDVMYGLIMTS
ncbi:uncharacterized protein LOC120695877 [Panicum virgatum]|uniref:uncharacterized protein LOC120695877 n=1 Tax=Panicum virgatum TaxID=38727 RepID=UPI0019D6401C|nr:uncharacterized protein LOC120695877 [Panicum virgatum]